MDVVVVFYVYLFIYFFDFVFVLNEFQIKHSQLPSIYLVNLIK